jgi:hypothetical protein
MIFNPEILYLNTYQLYRQLQNKIKICHIYFISYIVNLKYSQTCIKEVNFGSKKIWPYKTGDLLKEVQFHMKFSMTRQ